MTYNEALPLSGDLLQTLDSTSDSGLARFGSVEDMIKTLRPAQPVRCLVPKNLRANVETFKGFPGKAFYAVKVNTDPNVLRHLHAAGITHFDCASIKEVELIRGLFPSAHIAFMHPIKSREAIRAAYSEYGVRDFAVDTFEELHKVFEETRMATDLGIHVRLALPDDKTRMHQSGKFGAKPEDAAQLLKDADKIAHRVGLAFHVGGQCMDPNVYTEALAVAGQVLKLAQIKIDVLDVGGGFPVAYPEMEPPALSAYFEAIAKGVKELKLPKNCQVWGEPGRVLVTGGETLVVRVELRKGQSLYINDGGYGSLLDGMLIGQRWPVQMVRPGRRISKNLVAYQFYGPTCDSLDCLKGPFMLPEDAREGDFIIFTQQGAYNAVMQTAFNGFNNEMRVEITGAPVTRMRSRKSERPAQQQQLDIVAA